MEVGAGSAHNLYLIMHGFRTIVSWFWLTDAFSPWEDSKSTQHIKINNDFTSIQSHETVMLTYTYSGSFNFECPSVFWNMSIGCVLAKIGFNSCKCLNGSYFRHPSYFGFFIWSIGTQVLLINPVCTVGYTVVTWRFFRDRIPYPFQRFYFWLVLITLG